MKIAVLGAGAVGCYFGGMLARFGTPVTLIGRPAHVEAINRDGLYFDSVHFRGPVAVKASTDLAAARGSDIVLLCVKTLDTVNAMKAAAPYLRNDVVVVSMQNGVDNAERLRAALGMDALSAVVYVACEMTGPGRLKHNGRGDLVLPDRPAAQSLAALFERAGVPCRLSANIDAELWTKMIINCAYNAMSALARARYTRLVGNPLTHDLMRQVIEEVAAVAQASGVTLDTPALMEATFKLGETMAQAMSSMAQDISRGKRTEIDSLNGYVVRRAIELGLAAPVNQTLDALVKLMELEAAQGPVS
jgi:2-dehydropantoate 2-reductase